MKKKYPGPDRRHYMRYSFGFPTEYAVCFRQKGASRYQISYSGNICRDGIQILSPKPVAVGDSIEVNIVFRKKKKSRIALRGKVIWAHPRAEGEEAHFLGLRFLIRSEKKRAELRAFLNNHVYKRTLPLQS